jgi:hypothetical protein
MKSEIFLISGLDMISANQKLFARQRNVLGDAQENSCERLRRTGKPGDDEGINVSGSRLAL